MSDGETALREAAGGLLLLLAQAATACSRAEPAPNADQPEPGAPAAPQPVALSAAPVPGLEPIDVGAASASQTPNLHVNAEGAAYLTWVEPAEGGHALRLRKRAGPGWSPAITVAESQSMFVNWADFAAVASLSPDSLIATWLESANGGYGIQWARSTDDGAKWSAPARLHAHTGGPEYGFVSFARQGPDALAVFWLDGRASKGHEGGQMQLRAAVIGAEGEPRERRLVDDRVCDCCQTSAAATQAGPVVAYRDRNQDEIRDIVLAGPAPERRRIVGADGWKISGCPVNGPSVAASDAGLSVAWYTAASKATVRVAFASLDGPFEPPITVDLGDAVGRADVEWLDANSVVVSFLERDPADANAATLVARRVPRKGVPGPAFAVATTSASNASGFPRLSRTRDHLLWAWTQADNTKPPRVAVAQAPLTAL